MALDSIILWTPDTCGNGDPSDKCSIHLAYDSSLPANERVLTYVTPAQAQTIHQARIDAKVPNTNPNPQPPGRMCEAHKHLGMNATLFQTVDAENKLKNRVLAEIVTSLTLNDDDTRLVLWGFDVDRKLEIDVAGLAVSESNKTALQTAIDTKFGIGKVTVL